jgi:uncharacterized protein YbjT (DUF2867 family)
MEFWGTFLGDTIVNGGKTTIFGRGESPVNFVCVEDVANLVLMALKDPKAKNRIIEIGGPELLSMKQVVGILERTTGKPAKLSHIPVPMMRVMAVLMGLVNPVMSRLLKVSIFVDTTDDELIDMSETLERFPIERSSFDEVSKKLFASEPIP